MEEKSIPSVSSNLLMRLHPAGRVFLSLVVSVLVFILLHATSLTPLVRLTYCWDAFALTLLTLSWVIFFTGSAPQIREFARKEDGSTIYVFISVILGSLTSLFALFELFVSKEPTRMGIFEYLFAAVPAMLLAWATIHTSFAFHYAHIYYDNAPEDGSRHAEGLEFPREKKPDYLDFAYFSFVIGMTFQVSDVQVTSRRIRRLVLLHGMLSFLLNTFVVALTINLIAGFKH